MVVLWRPLSVSSVRQGERLNQKICKKNDQKKRSKKFNRGKKKFGPHIYFIVIINICYFTINVY